MSTQQFVTTCLFPPLFVNKHNGEPLSFGRVKFYSTKDKAKPKDIYILTNGNYQSIGADVGLNGGGYLTVGDSGDPLIPYFNTRDNNNNREGYYYEVFTAQGDFHFSEDEILANETDYTSNDILNKDFLTNGNFLRHLTLNETNALKEGRVREQRTHFAFGGWVFETDADVKAEQDYIRFDKQNPPVQTRYLVNRSCEQTSIATNYKQIRKICYGVTDINSPSLSPLEGYTLCLLARAAVPVTLRLNIIRNYGDQETRLSLGDITLTDSLVTYNKNFNVPYENLRVSDNAKDRDFWALEIEEPLSVNFDYFIGEIHLFNGVLNIKFPVNQISDVAAASSMVGPMMIPNYDRMDVGLPVYLTEAGYAVDKQVTGRLFHSMNELKSPHYLPFDDQVYATYDLSPEGIPYKRLWEVLSQKTPIPGLSRFGTGKNYVTANACHGLEDHLFLVSSSQFDEFNFNTTLVDVLTFQSSIKQAVDSGRYSTTMCPNLRYTPSGLITTARGQGLVDMGQLNLPVDYFANTVLLDEFESSQNRILFNVREALRDDLVFTIPNPTPQTVYYHVRVGQGTTTPANHNEVFLLGGCDIVDSTFAVKAAINNRSHAYLKVLKPGADIPAGGSFQIGVTNPTKTITFYFVKDGVGLPPPDATITVPVVINATMTIKDVRLALIGAINSYQFCLPSTFNNRMLRSAYPLTVNQLFNVNNDPFFESDLDIDWVEYRKVKDLYTTGLTQEDYVKTPTTSVDQQPISQSLLASAGNGSKKDKFIELQGALVENKTPEYEVLDKPTVKVVDGSTSMQDLTTPVGYIKWGENTTKALAAYLYIHI